MKWETVAEAFIRIMWVFCLCILAYGWGRRDYTNELACARSVVKHHKDEAKYFHDKWREEETANFRLQIKLDRLKEERQ